LDWRAAIGYLCDDCVIGKFIYWRGYLIVHTAATAHGPAAINLCVWTNGGMGNLYRWQHELFPLDKEDNAAHINNTSNSASTAIAVHTSIPEGAKTGLRNATQRWTEFPSRCLKRAGEAFVQMVLRF
jgi:hypothetical protein